MRLHLDMAEVERAVEEYVRRVGVFGARSLSVSVEHRMLDGESWVEAVVEIGDPMLAARPNAIDPHEPAEPTLVLP